MNFAHASPSSLPCRCTHRSLSTSARTLAPRSSSSGSAALTSQLTATRGARAAALRTQKDKDSEHADFIGSSLPKWDYDDLTSFGHVKLEERRRYLKYMRLTEFQLPELRKWRVPFTPPSPQTFIRLRLQHYQGEEHPASQKATVTFKITDIPFINSNSTNNLNSASKTNSPNKPKSKSESKPESQKNQTSSSKMQVQASPTHDPFHKFRVLAGPRWNAETDRFKMSCEMFPNVEQNERWLSETVSKLVKEAENPSDPMSDIPPDPRPTLTHLLRRKELHSNLLHPSTSPSSIHNPFRFRATKDDFPMEWFAPESREKVKREREERLGKGWEEERRKLAERLRGEVSGKGDVTGRRDGIEGTSQSGPKMLNAAGTPPRSSSSETARAT